MLKWFLRAERVYICLLHSDNLVIFSVDFIYLWIKIIFVVPIFSIKYKIYYKIKVYV